MKLAWLALLWFGVAAFGQSPSPKKIDPDKLFQMPDKFAHPAPDVGTLRRQPFPWNRLVPGHPSVLAPPPEWKNPQIDPKIILHPPWHSRAKGKDFAHHLYPDLKFLPLQRGTRVPR